MTIPAVLLIPRIDAIFSVTMPRKALVEPLLLLAGGWALSRLFSAPRPSVLAPPAVTAATLFLSFWMIPRSIDLTQIHFSANAFYIACLFAAGFLLSRSLPSLSGVARAAYAFYASSMLVALGVLYASQSVLLCSAFTLADQHTFGWVLAAVGLATYLFALASVTRWLVPAAVLSSASGRGVNTG